MTSQQKIVSTALEGRHTRRPATGPLAVHYCARVANVSLRQYTTSAATMASCIERYYETFRPDAVWVSADTWVTAEAAGARVGFPDDDQPLCGQGPPLVQSPADVDRIPAPDPTAQGRCPLMLDALQQVLRRLGPEVFVVACFDQYPFSLACALMGIDRLMLAVHDDPPLVEALLARCEDYAAAYALAMASTGADMLSGGDSPAGLLGPELYREMALPAEQRLIGRIKATASQPVSLHICGNATPIIPAMADSGADVLEIDQEVDIRQAAHMAGPDVALWGNLDPVRVLAHGNPDTVARATRRLLDQIKACAHRRFVLSSGCTLAVETPAENLRAMQRAAAHYPWSSYPSEQ